MKSGNNPHDQHAPFTRVKAWQPFHSRFDPCRPIGLKYYSTPPNLYMGFQSPNLQQFPAKTALRKGTLWPALYDPYENPYEGKGGKNQ